MNVQQMVGQQIGAARNALRVTQQELGDGLKPLLGRAWSRQAVSAAEAGERAFTATELLALAHVLGVDSAFLLTSPQPGQQIDMPTGVSLVLRPPTRVPHGTAAATWDAVRATISQERARLNASAEAGARNLRKIEQLARLLVAGLSGGDEDSGQNSRVE